jgi:hypothetical protein
VRRAYFKITVDCRCPRLGVALEGEGRLAAAVEMARAVDGRTGVQVKAPVSTVE